MGIIQRQTIKNNIVAYLAVIVGALATIYVYPEDLELKGFADGLLKLVFLVGPIVNVGVHVVMVRFLPHVDADKLLGSQQLLTRALVVQTFNLLLLVAANAIFGDAIVQYFSSKGYEIGLLQNYRWELLSLLFPMVYSVTLTTHILNFQRIALPAFFNNLFQKLGLLLVFTLTIWNHLSTDHFAYWLAVLYTMIFLCLCGVALKMKILRFRWGKLKLEGKTMEDMRSLAFFSLFSGIGASLATNLDTVSVNTFIGNVDTGIYSFAVFIIGTMLIPFKAINQICAPIVTNSWKEQNIGHLEMLYKDSATALFSAGMVIFIGCLVCLPSVYGFTDKTPQYAVGYTATLILGGGQLINQLTSINDVLITYTDHYRWMMLFVLLLGGLNMVLNYYFISVFGWGLEGAAFATFLALLVFNLVKVTFIQRRMGINPFSWSILYVAAAAAGIGGLVYFVPTTGNAYVDFVIRGSLVVGLFFCFFRYTKFVPIMRRAILGGLKGAFG
jgi:O-antigen/teichoic acid export membrane protein